MKKKAFTLAELGLIFFIMAILAVLFYRTARPDRVVYNNLYYTVYEQFNDVFFEIKSYYQIDEDENIISAYSIDSDGRKYLDLVEFANIFNTKVNFIGSPVQIERPDTDEDGNVRYRSGEYNNEYMFYLIDNLTQKVDIFNGNFSTLANGMQLKFDIIQDATSDKVILLATIDINGDNEPNIINKDIIQLEINEDGVFPIGALEENQNMLAFNIISRYTSSSTPGILNMTEPNIVKDSSTNTQYRNLNYVDASCIAGVPAASHHYQYRIMESKYVRTDCPANNPIYECNPANFRGRLNKICELQTVKP